jgi:hypothetical protein
MAELGQLPGVQFYLRLTIKGTDYNPTNIYNIVIKEWIFNILPTIEIQLLDDGYLTEIFPLEDNEDIDIVLAKNEDDENPIELTFVLNDYEVGIQGDNRKSIVSLTGYLKVDDMFVSKSRSFSTQNSSSVLQQISNEIGLTFVNSQNIVPSDNMTWHQASQNNLEFIRHVLDRVYIPNDVAFFYGNTSKELVFTSLVSEINKENIKRAKFSIEGFQLDIKDENDINDTIWYSSYSIVNCSGYFNKINGYGFGYGYYDLNGNIVYNEYSNITKLTDLSFRNKNYVGKIVKYNNCNKDYIAGNLYGVEYFESMLRNRFLKDNFFANSLVLNVNALSQVKLMDTIDIDIPSLFNEGESNEVMSGFYLVAGVQHQISNGGIYNKKVALGRNGMNKSPDLKSYEVEQ